MSKYMVQSDAETIAAYATLAEALEQLEHWCAQGEMAERCGEMKAEEYTGRFDRVLNEAGEVVAYCEGGKVIEGPYQD